ncbi:cellulase family glycosylhydrolase [Streptomyces hoynatensis]|uniref:cellulase family glycosylhydrolase n=1 Tax=Streptomyces hoynatensis TaxID=1141874 RepID=UPI0015771405|nr:cellulase family glycosylhydrolase [Streptomyces hoynatensis]
MDIRRALRAFGVAGVVLTCWAVGSGAPALAGQAGPERTGEAAAAAAAAPELQVSGNRLVTESGDTFRPLGVNRSGGEFGCVQGKEIFDGPVDQAAVDAMKTWHVNTVRVPLNEECWLGTEGVPAGGPGAAEYQQAVEDYANLLVANGINVILDLHWSRGEYTGPGAGCPDVAATCQKPMPDLQYAPEFWSQVATAFKGNDAVIFDLFNEPYPDAANNWSDATAAWTCLRDGGTCAGIGYEVAGMQTLVDAVRATGATNVIMTGGLEWTNNLSQWLDYRPDDPTGNLMASWHSYNFNGCVTTSCWDGTIGTVAAQVPVQIGETGQDTCAHDYIDQVMNWADAHGVGYTAWTWNPWGCTGGSVLIADWNGTPTSTYGEGFRDHLLTQNPGDGTDPDPGTAACRVAVGIQSWGTGLTETLSLTNTGTTAVNGWSLAFDLPEGQTITNGWNATYSPGSGHVTATHAAYNATLAPGATLSLGFQATHTGNAGAPTGFTLNGSPCTTS